MSEPSPGSLFVVTGPMASGKTTVARLLAQRFPRGVHLEGDIFRRCIVAGRHEMTPSLDAAALQQLKLRYRVATEAAQRYAAEGFSVALEDVVAGPLLGDFVAQISHRPLFVIVLVPPADVLAARDAQRATTGYGAWRAADLHRAFIEDTPRIGLWLDTSNQTPEDTVDAILSRRAEAVI